jgi:2-keto-4-pentenoate hydratase/2-oxohepta-3-ene-1,7-dioic acid hydratase in catechol pathway
MVRKYHYRNAVDKYEVEIGIVIGQPFRGLPLKKERRK